MNPPDHPVRRTLWFDSIDELLVEVDRVMTAEANGQLQTSGSWTPGQILCIWRHGSSMVMTAFP